MTPTKITGEKKDELIQLRVEKSFADQLNDLAIRKQVPLSVMLRTWMAEKVRDENKLELADRSNWVNERLANLRFEDFDQGPLITIHLVPLSSKAKLNVEALKEHTYNLTLGYRRYGQTEFHQKSLVVTTRTGSMDGPLVVRGEGFMNGRLELIKSIPVFENMQLPGANLDAFIIDAVRSLCAIYQAQNVEMGYALRISLLRAKDYAPVIHKTSYSSPPLPLFKDNRIDLTELTITSPDQLASAAKTASYLMDTLDELWRASGNAHSPSFDENKRWINQMQDY
jgi:hypothetical protein